MGNSLNWQTVALFWGIIAASFGFSWIVSRNASEADRRLHERCDKITEMVASFRESVAREYFQRNDAKGLEDRIESRLQRMETKIDDAMSTFMGAFQNDKK